MKLFNKPRWLKPEIDEPIYYLHVIIISVIVLGILQYFYHGEMLTFKNVLLSIPLITLGDIVAHTVLKLD
jgi:hypothetical protein